MEEEKKVNTNTTSDETGYINTDELREALKEQEKEKEQKQSWFKRLFSKKKK